MPVYPGASVQQQRDHHRRIKRRPAVAVLAVGAIERREIHLRDRVEHEPREMPFRQPLAHVRRHQKRLRAITPDEVLPHRGSLLNPPDSTTLCATATMPGDTPLVVFLPYQRAAPIA